ncbi:hypothetical protein C7444_109165 [Sphaerotilus hippei]|uniref:HTH-type transcriptional regulator/antitoxin HigA n=1 Tax=Sphaerotilus hippei TaxID=744406 RepID=A0A318HAI5_9BURK|nr:hypothetical protein [Sphaerotilus hippei]PXW95595.1 hypothetical protein C7444_109165 [Sphaerotilus hippei]
MSDDIPVLRPLRTEADYRAALQRVETLFDLPEEPDPASDLGAYFDALITLIQAYERRHYPVEAPDPIEAITFRMAHIGGRCST